MQVFRIISAAAAIVMSLFLAAGAASLHAAEAAPLPAVATLGSGWNTLHTNGLCSTGTPYLFYVRPASASNNLLIQFNGGGACWFGQACDQDSEPNVHFPYAEMPENNPLSLNGIFAFDNPENPFRDYSVIDVPYCTADVHIGAGAREYHYVNAEGSAVTETTYHNGHANSSAVLEWVYANFPAPAKVVVSGTSAGAIGASFYAGMIAEHYGNVPVVLIADSAGGYNSPNLPVTFEAWRVADILPDWPEYAGETNRTLSFEDFYIASSRHAGNLRIAQYNTAYDQVQIDFTLLLGDSPASFDMPSRIFNNYVEIESAVDVFWHYTAPGDAHAILSRPTLYTLSVNGVRFVDWLRAVVDANAMDVSCADTPAGCRGAAPGN